MHESELARFLEGTADAAFTVDLEGRIRTWNSAAVHMFGCDAQAVLEAPCAAVINGHRANGTQMCKQECLLLEQARVVHSADHRSDHSNIVNFDMEARPLGRRPFWVNVSLLVVDDPHTQRRLVVHFVRDITDRKCAERFTADVVSLVHRLANGKGSGELPPTESLTVQERRVLELLHEGDGTKEIARKLGISIGTLRNHIHNLDLKLGTHGRLEAVMQALKRGLI